MAKKRKMKLPKRIAGVKIPKGIRKGPIGSFLTSSGGQLVIAEALLAAGGFYAARRLDPNTPAVKQYAIRSTACGPSSTVTAAGVPIASLEPCAPACTRFATRCTSRSRTMHRRPSRSTTTADTQDGDPTAKKTSSRWRDVAAGGDFRYPLIEHEHVGPIGRLTAPMRRWLIDWGKRRVTRRFEREPRSIVCRPRSRFGRSIRGQSGCRRSRSSAA